MHGVENGNPDRDDPPATSPVDGPPLVTGDPRQFSAYVLVPGHPTGKGRVFLDLLGYRPRSQEDANELLATYVEQAREKVAQGDYAAGKQDRHGQRYTIEIELRGTFVLSGWILRPDGSLWLATPFAGFSR